MRLGLHADLVYARDGDLLTADASVVQFFLGMAERVDELVLFGRLRPEPGRSHYRVAGPNVRFVPLPHYPRLTALRQVAGAMRSASAAVSSAARDLDAIWLFGPHPYTPAFARAGRSVGCSVFLGVRQHFPSYVVNRLPNPRWKAVVPAVYALDAAFRRMARRTPAVVVGEKLGQQYQARGGPVLVCGLPLVRDADIVEGVAAEAKDWSGARTILNVGRLDPEKNPLLLAEVLAGLRRRDERWRMVVVGDGPLFDDLRRRSHALDLDSHLELVGYEPFGPALLARYRASHAFLHVSLTEGQPQVLVEAHASGLPVVATSVGGVPAAVGHGSRGLLVPPSDPLAAAGALERLAVEPALRGSLVRDGLDYARQHTMEAEVERILQFFAGHMGSP